MRVDPRWVFSCFLLLSCKRTHEASAPAMTSSRPSGGDVRTIGAPVRTSRSGIPFGGAKCRGIHPSVTLPTAAAQTVDLVIDAAGTGCRIAPDFAGTNYEAFPGWGADTSMSVFQQRAFREAGMQLLRYPGGEPGSWVDLLMTAKCKDGTNANFNAPPYKSVWNFARAAGAHALMLQLNPTTQFCGQGNQDDSGAHAAAIAKDALTAGVEAVFEVGNEPDLAGSFFQSRGGRDAYTKKFIELARAVHEANPRAEVYGPVVCGLGGNCTFPVSWDSGWIDAFLAETGDRATGPGKGVVDGISLHVYWHSEWSFSDLAAAKIDKYGFPLYWADTVMPHLRAIIAKHDTRDLPIAVSEISVGNGMPKDPAQKQNMFSVLTTLDTIGAFAASGLRSFQWFDANAAGPADFWMITPDGARPVFYAFAAWSKMGDEVLALKSTVNPNDVAAYATRKGDGSLQVLIVNKTTSSHEVRIDFKGASVAGKLQRTYTALPGEAGAETSASVIYNGAKDPSPATLPPPASATNTAPSPKVDVPAFSAVVLTWGP